MVKGIGILIGFVFMTFVLIALNRNHAQPQIPVTPNQLIALESRVTILEGQVKELRRVVGIDGGLSEGLQKKGKK